MARAPPVSTTLPWTHAVADGSGGQQTDPYFHGVRRPAVLRCVAWPMIQWMNARRHCNGLWGALLTRGWEHPPAFRPQNRDGCPH